jgi:ATP-dependent protease ClpP protease subunit
MAKNSELMIHDAWGLCVGNADDMVKMAGELDHFSDNIASIYAAKAGGDIAVWRAAMKAETWYSAEEAVAAGLADRVDGAKSAAKNEFDLTVYQYAGREHAPAPIEPPAPAVRGHRPRSTP